MAEGIWTQGLIDVGNPATAMAGYPPKDNFRRSTSGTAAGTAGIVISAKPGRFVRGVFVNTSLTVAYYIQVFDKATAPVANDVPIWQTRVLPVSAATAPGGALEVDLTNVNGLPCLAGIGIAISSTPGLLTLAAANDLAYRSIIYTAQN